MTGPGLPAFLIVGALLFAVGIVGVLSQRNAVMILMGVDIMLAASMLNLVAFWRFVQPAVYDGQFFVIVVLTIEAVEMAAGLAATVLAFRTRGSSSVDLFADLER